MHAPPGISVAVLADRATARSRCGNGWFSYLAYRSGATVVGINNEAGQVAKAQAFYNGWLQIPEDRLQFRLGDLRSIAALTIDPCDEIICYETLEHILDDAALCREFHRLLSPGGNLHICVPNAGHPRWASEGLDTS